MNKAISLLLAAVLCTALCSCRKEIQPQAEQIKAICELSAVKVYYNNVAKSHKNASAGWHNILEQDREFWIEYDGIAEIGIDMSKVVFEYDKNTVYITLPDAELLNTRIVRETFDESCYITNSDSWWNRNKITTEDQQSAINKAQAEMQTAVSANSALFERAKKTAMQTIENYIDKINDVSGTNYTVVWK